MVNIIEMKKVSDTTMMLYFDSLAISKWRILRDRKKCLHQRDHVMACDSDSMLQQSYYPNAHVL